MENVYGGFQRSPEIQTWGRGSEWEPRHQNAGRIDYAAYGGEASGFADNRALDALERSKQKGFGGDKYKYVGKKEYYGDAWRNRDTWSKVAKHLGIKDVDSESDLRQMYDFVRGYKFEEEKEEAEEPEYTPVATQPVEEKPQEVQDAVKDYEDSKLENPGNQQPKFSDVIKTNLGGNPTSDPSLDAIKHGDDLNSWYQTKFVPHLEKEAHATAHEIGNSSRYFLDKFVFQPPELGDPKELFQYYSDQIKNDD